MKRIKKHLPINFPIQGQKQPVYIMAYDPSMTAWGWSVIDIVLDRVIATGCVKTEPNHSVLKIRKGDDWMRRVREINSVLLGQIKKYDVQYLLTEFPHGAQSYSAALSQGTVAAMVDTLSLCVGIGIEYYLEGDCKKEVCGKRSLSKDDMVDLMRKEFPEWIWNDTKWKDQGIADSLAVYCLAKKQSGILKFLSR